MAAWVYRVARAPHPLFDGTGAARHGARWSSPGREVVYAAFSYAGALLELLAHARRFGVAAEYRCLPVQIPDGLRVESIVPGELHGWEAPDYVQSRAAGDAWLDSGRSAVLRVPSLVGWPHEWNAVINPAHPDAQRLYLGAVHRVIWDARLLPGAHPAPATEFAEPPRQR